MAKKKVGTVSHYYDKIGVAVIELSSSLSQGANIEIDTKSGVFTQPVESIEVEHEKIKKAKKGLSVGLKVNQKVSEGDLIYEIK